MASVSPRPPPRSETSRSARASVSSAEASFGTALRKHRTLRGLSQERLAEEAEISTRHLSCLETGRAKPSRSMVLVLGSALELPLRERNALLEASGFVAAYADAPLDAPEAESLRRAVDLILRGVEPNGAIACDRVWNVLQMNTAAGRLLGAFMDVTEAPTDVLTNALLAVLHPKGLRPAIVNFDETATLMLDRARREGARMKDDPLAAAMAEKIAALSDFALPNPATRAPSGPFLTVHLRRGPLEARLFTTIATIGTPMDATAEEIRIETYFPADDATARLMRDLATTGA